MARAYGSGSIRELGGTYYGRWYVDGSRVEKVIGPIRKPGTKDGLTKAMAEARLRTLMGETKAPPVVERLTVAEVGARLIKQKRDLGREANTIESYESYLRVHIAPFLGSKEVTKLSKDHVQAFMAHCIDGSQSVKSTKNYLGFLHGICEYAIREGWASSNPCKLVEKPRGSKSNEIHFLTPDELNTLLTKGSVQTDVGSVDVLMYFTAAMTGLRQGELIGLRWKDIDWTAQRVRVRQSYSRGRKKGPKSNLSFRSVPLADTVAGELDRHFQTSLWQADQDLVFAHPYTGRPMERSRLLKRFKAAVARAKVGQFEPSTDQQGNIKLDKNGSVILRAILTFHDLRHTFGTQMAAAGVPLRTLQAWMGHEDIKTTMIYADYMPAGNEADVVGQAMKGIRLSPVSSPVLSETQEHSEALNPANTRPQD
jgi:integrase